MMIKAGVITAMHSIASSAVDATSTAQPAASSRRRTVSRPTQSNPTRSTHGVTS